MGQRHERRCCANHDWRADGNTHANANRYSDSHIDSYSNSDSNSNAYGHTNCDGDTYCNASAYRDSHGNRHCNGNPDCYYYAYSKAYPITEDSFYTAASRNTEAKTLIAPVAVQSGA